MLGFCARRDPSQDERFTCISTSARILYCTLGTTTASTHEAEQWAHKVMRVAGIPVPRAETRQAKENISYMLRRVKRKKGRRIDPRLRAFGK